MYIIWQMLQTQADITAKSKEERSPLKNNREQTALIRRRRVARGGDAVRDVEEDGARRRGEVGDDNDAPAFFQNEQTVRLARRGHDASGVGEDESEERVGVSVGQRGRRGPWCTHL